MVLTLRDYQEECIAAHWRFFDSNKEGHPLFVVPTGAGKSLILSEFVKVSITTWPEARFLILTHVKELIRQNREEFERHLDGTDVTVGTYSAGLGERSTDCSVLFAGIQSVYKRAAELGHFHVVLIDEAHLVPKKGMGRYRQYLEELRAINPNVRVCGYTATHYRVDGGYLHKGDGRIFTNVAYEVQLPRLIEAGYLAPLRAKKPPGGGTIDTSNVGMAAGDFKKGELEDAARAEGCVEAAVAETVRIGNQENRQAWLVFAAGKAHAGDILAEFERHGVEADHVFGDTPKDIRDAVIQRFKDGRLRVLVNVGVLTTGFNAPRCDLMAVMRPTGSTALYVQIMGRGMRTFPGKKDCLVLDYGENVKRHGPINKVKPKHERVDGSEKEAAPTKSCPHCGEILDLGVNPCPSCGFEWEGNAIAVEHAKVAAWESPIDLEANKPRTCAVTGWHFREHQKEGRPISLRVDFLCGMRTFTEWVCLQHGGYAEKKAKRWWATHALDASKPPPDSVAEALTRTDELELPASVVVVDDGRYERVKRSIFHPVETNTE